MLPVNSQCSTYHKELSHKLAVESSIHACLYVTLESQTTFTKTTFFTFTQI